MKDPKTYEAILRARLKDLEVIKEKDYKGPDILDRVGDPASGTRADKFRRRRREGVF